MVMVVPTISVTDICSCFSPLLEQPGIAPIEASATKSDTNVFLYIKEFLSGD